MGDSERELELALQREHRQREKQEQTRQRVERVRAMSEVPTREAARALGVNKETVTKYRRLAGVSPPPPVKHLGGGRWVPVGKRRR